MSADAAVLMLRRVVSTHSLEYARLCAVAAQRELGVPVAWLDAPGWKTRLEDPLDPRDTWIKAFNRLEAAISHHKAADRFKEDHDDALYAARDRILRDLQGGER